MFWKTSFFTPFFNLLIPFVFFPLHVLSFISTSAVQPFKLTQSKFLLTFCSKWLHWKGRSALICVALAEAAVRDVKKGILKNFAKFTEKALFQSLFFNKVASYK